MLLPKQLKNKEIISFAEGFCPQLSFFIAHVEVLCYNNYTVDLPTDSVGHRNMRIARYHRGTWYMACKIRLMRGHHLSTLWTCKIDPLEDFVFTRVHKMYFNIKTLFYPLEDFVFARVQREYMSFKCRG